MSARRGSRVPGDSQQRLLVTFERECHVHLNFIITETTTEAERNSLEDVLFSEQENFLEPDIYEDKFLVVLRLSPRPEQLVKGYEFKMLNK